VTTVTIGTSVLMDVEGGVDSDVVITSEAVIVGEAVADALSDDVLSEGVLSEGKTKGDVAVLGGTGMGTAAENPIDEQRSKAAQRVIK